MSESRAHPQATTGMRGVGFASLGRRWSSGAHELGRTATTCTCPAERGRPDPAVRRSRDVLLVEDELLRHFVNAVELGKLFAVHNDELLQRCLRDSHGHSQEELE